MLKIGTISYTNTVKTEYGTSTKDYCNALETWLTAQGVTYTKTVITDTTETYSVIYCFGTKWYLSIYNSSSALYMLNVPDAAGTNTSIYGALRYSLSSSMTDCKFLVGIVLTDDYFELRTTSISDAASNISNTCYSMIQMNAIDLSTNVDVKMEAIHESSYFINNFCNIISAGKIATLPGTGTGVYVSMDYGYSYEVISAYDDIRLYVLLSSDTAYRIKALYKRRVDNGLITRCIKDTEGNTWYLGGQISSGRVDGTGALCLKI